MYVSVFIIPRSLVIIVICRVENEVSVRPLKDQFKLEVEGELLLSFSSLLVTVCLQFP